jgi:hypothetical protein
MKNLIALVTLAFFLLPFSLNSQFLTGFGVKGGVTFGMQQMEFKPGVNYMQKPIIGFNAGLYSEMLNNRMFNIVLESGYEQRGHIQENIKTDEFGTEIGTYEFRYRTHYITIGALGKIKYETKSVSPYLIIGPRLDLYLGYNVTYHNISIPPEHEEAFTKSEVHEQTKSINYSLNLGAGLQFEKLLPFKTLVEFNYSPPINSSYNSRVWLVKDHYFNIKLGINFIKEKTKKTKK